MSPDTFFLILDLKEEAERLITSSIASRTKTLYDKHWTQFKKFCVELQLPWRKDRKMEALELWVVSLNRQKISYGSILTRLSAVRHKWKKLVGDRELSSQRLTLMLKGLKRKSRKRPEKNPITMSHLKRLHNAANRLGKDRACLFKAMSTLAFFGFLRPSEFCISRSKHHLLRKDVRLGKSGKSCRINFRSFKHSDGTRVVKIEE